VRVVSWNVRSLRDDARGVATLLAQLAPDVVVLQEAPRLLGWRSACARLARRSGLVRVTGGRPAAGNLLLTAAPVDVLTAYDVLLARRPGLHRRGAVCAVLRRGRVRLAVVGTHLDLDLRARLDSARQVRAAAPAGLPLVLGADVNEEPGGPAWAALGAGLADAGRGTGPTYPLRRPAHRLDAVFVDPTLPVADVHVPRPGPVTDHLPVVVDLAL
jgi:endonuclease/exonuclease/phosphatase family metal-dependent hydrolase